MCVIDIIPKSAGFGPKLNRNETGTNFLKG